LVILDNFGFFLAKVFRSPTTGANFTGFVLKRQLGGALFGTSLYNTNTNSTIFNDGGVVRQAQVGKGTTPATRQDFAIESPFTNSPESAKNNSADGAFNSGLGLISQPTLISNTGGSGSITEVIKVISVRDQQGGALNVPMAIFRDSISPVSFINGESINIDHEVLI